MNPSLTEEPVAEGRVVVSSRVFPASREHLFGTFADPECLARWWGPKGFTNTHPPVRSQTRGPLAF